MKGRHAPGLLLIAIVAWGACVFDDGGPSALGPVADGGTADRGPLEDLRADVVSVDGRRDVPFVRLDISHDGPFPDTAPADTRGDTVPSACRDCGTVGCNYAAGRCNLLAPSNLPASLVAARQNDALLGHCTMTASGGTTMDGESGRFGGCRPQGNQDSTRGGTYWGIVNLTGGGQAAVFVVRSLEVPSDITLRGVGALPIIIYALETITINGSIDVGARSVDAGPGGGAGGENDGQDAAACEGGEGKGGSYSSPTVDKSGGGGGGWGQRGAKGGDAGSVAGGLGGELPLSAPSRALVPLRGGCGGGAGGGSSSDGGPGGAGGGALQLSAGQLLVLDGLGIRANGGGGLGGEFSDGGGGGGSGGSILLESFEVRVTSGTPLSANGGGGGAGDPDDSPNGVGASGDDGPHDTTAAAGGVAVTPAGNGGSGGARGAQPTAGQGAPNAGGGGGGAGRIHVRANVGVIESQKLSPPVVSDSQIALW